MFTDTAFPTKNRLFLKMLQEIQPILLKSRDALKVQGQLIYEKEHKADAVRYALISSLTWK